MAKVYFVREEISIEVPVGTSVLEAEIQAGLAPDVPCGGQGTCGHVRRRWKRTVRWRFPGRKIEVKF